MQGEEIFGLDKSLDECDRIHFNVPEWVRAEENGLFSRKWFDYRCTHPVHATYLFAHAYAVAYKEAFAKVYDRERAAYVTGLAPGDVFDYATRRSNGVTGLVRARQHADLLGMPYLEFVRIGIDWALRRKRDYIPRPMHLYGFDLLTAIQATWAERQAGQVFVAEDPLFRNGAYQGLPIQDAHHEWLLQQAALRPNRDHYLAAMLYDRDVLLETKVAARFGADQLDRARRLH